MEAETKVRILDGAKYNHLFPVARVVDETKKRGATVADTVKILPQIVAQTKWQAKQYVAQELAGLNQYQACEKLWHFVKQHIAYQKDKDGLEQVRSPRRLWHDRKGDCDCMTTFVACCLVLLNIPVILRITKYSEDRFQHIYPIVPLQGGRYITMDCVANHFNQEVPYTEKQDYKMDLQFLDGLDTDLTTAGLDAQIFLSREEDIRGMGEFGKLLKRKADHSKPKLNLNKAKKSKVLQKVKTTVKKGMHVVNRVNPATVVLRAGILASMKLNLFKVAENIKWGYLSEEEARRKGADMSKFGKLKNVLTKLESIFHSTGGLPQNLKKAILTGKGNTNHEVSGLGYLADYPIELMGFDTATPLTELLGIEVYDSEISGVEGLGELGEPATGAAIAAATTVLTAIAALIKSIGNVFPKKQVVQTAEDRSQEDGGNGDGNQEDRSAEDGSSEDGSNGDRSQEDSNNEETNNNLPMVQETANEEATETENLPTEQEEVEGFLGTEQQPNSIRAFWDKNKTWLKPAGIGLGLLFLAYIGYQATHSSEKKQPYKRSSASLSGVPKKRRKGRKRSTRHRHAIIELM